MEADRCCAKRLSPGGLKARPGGNATRASGQPNMQRQRHHVASGRRAGARFSTASQTNRSLKPQFMKTKPHSAFCILHSAFPLLASLALWLGSLLPADAQWQTQSILVKPGWTAVYLHVDPSYTNLDSLI